MEKLDLSKIVRKIVVKAEIDKVYKLFSTQKGLETWFLEKVINLSSNGTQRLPNENVEANDTYIWKWNNFEGEEKGTILSANGTDFIELSFAGGVVSISLSVVDNGVTLLCLEQTIPDNDARKRLELFYGCGCGWTFWLTNLKAYLEYGVLLHTPNNPYVEKYPNYGYDYVTV